MLKFTFEKNAEPKNGVDQLAKFLQEKSIEAWDRHQPVCIACVRILSELRRVCLRELKFRETLPSPWRIFSISFVELNPLKE